MKEAAECIHGFYVDKHESWLMHVASKENGVVTCYDLSGFMGSWEGKEVGYFFPSDNPTQTLCKNAMKRAQTKANELNKLTSTNN